MDDNKTPADMEAKECCDTCLSTYDNTDKPNGLLWDCKKCHWCFECIQHGLLSTGQMESEWPLNWCGHEDAAPIHLATLLARIKGYIDADLFARFDKKLLEWSGVACPSCKHISLADSDDEKKEHGRLLLHQCPQCEQEICKKCHSPYHDDKTPCQSSTETSSSPTTHAKTRKMIEAALQEEIATCPTCKKCFSRTKEGCHHVVCPKPCNQNFCFYCSRDWGVCKGQCEKGVAELMTREVEGADVETISALLGELREEIEQEVQRVGGLMGKKEVEGMRKEADVLVADIEEAIQGGQATHKIFEAMEEKVTGFLKPLRKLRGNSIQGKKEGGKKRAYSDAAVTIEQGSILKHARLEKEDDEEEEESSEEEKKETTDPKVDLKDPWAAMFQDGDFDREEEDEEEDGEDDEEEEE
jgi:hypothetical protein